MPMSVNIAFSADRGWIVAHTQRALEQLEAERADLDLVETLLASRSESEALLAYASLRGSMRDRSLVMLANIREVIREIPSAPFQTGTGMDSLLTADYEFTGHSYRSLFESDHGLFGLEFVGGGTLCEAIIVHTLTSRYALHGTSESSLTPEILAVMVNHNRLLDELLEGLQALGIPLDPAIYVEAEDFPREHAGQLNAIFDDLI
jgi:hypothetical protein